MSDHPECVDCGEPLPYADLARCRNCYSGHLAELDRPGAAWRVCNFCGATGPQRLIHSTVCPVVIRSSAIAGH
jgi:hypothetical protein